jgi:hypothetical protein
MHPARIIWPQKVCLFLLTFVFCIITVLTIVSHQFVDPHNIYIMYLSAFLTMGHFLSKMIKCWQEFHSLKMNRLFLMRIHNNKYTLNSSTIRRKKGQMRLPHYFFNLCTETDRTSNTSHENLWTFSKSVEGTRTYRLWTLIWKSHHAEMQPRHAPKYSFGIPYRAVNLLPSLAWRMQRQATQWPIHLSEKMLQKDYYH